MTSIQRIDLLSRFTCLGDKCEDTCCRGWSMQVDAPTVEKYRSTNADLASSVEDDEGTMIMRKDTAGVCVKFEGLCGIQKTYGEDFLGDACHFYPRAVRGLGDSAVMTATMSCPEIVRLALYSDAPLNYETVDVARLPFMLKDSLPEGWTQEQALSIHRAFLLSAHDETASVEQIFLRIASVARSLDRMDKKSWPVMVDFYLKNADMRVAAIVPMPQNTDPFNILHALCGLAVAARKKLSDRLALTISDMEKALDSKLDWQNVKIDIGDNALALFLDIRKAWHDNYEQKFSSVLRRWLAMQLSLNFFPFGGLGANLGERVTIIGVRLATIKLALMASCSIYGDKLTQEDVVRVIQSVSRFLDHLGDPAFSLSIYKETGWDQEGRMRGMLEI